MARTQVSARKSQSGSGGKKKAVVRMTVDVPVRYRDLAGVVGTISVRATPSMGAYEVAREACKTLGEARAPFQRAFLRPLSNERVILPVPVVEKIRQDRKCTPSSNLPSVREGAAVRGLFLTFGELPPLNPNAWRAYRDEPDFKQWVDGIAMGGQVRAAKK